MKVINSYTELLRESSLQNVCMKVEPDIMDEKKINPDYQKIYTVLPVIENDEVVQKALVKDKQLYFCIDLKEDVMFIDPQTNETQMLNQKDNILLKRDGGWEVKVMKDFSTFDYDYKIFPYNEMISEKEAANSVQNIRCLFMEVALKEKYQDFIKQINKENKVDTRYRQYGFK